MFICVQGFFCLSFNKCNDVFLYFKETKPASILLQQQYTKPHKTLIFKIHLFQNFKL